jgi:16S rRNA (adenine1518-N6/adenine1519-N6)-dimethyltransferase
VRPSKSLGQNFLVDPNLAAKLVGAAMELAPRRVVEIGPGLGALTVLLAQTGLPVVCFEKDRRLQAPLQELMAPFPNFQLVVGDFLCADLSGTVDEQTVVVGNLPYYVTTPILERLWNLQPPLRGMVVTVQREVAQRLRARPGSAEYGSLTVFAAYCLERLEVVAQLPPSVFAPQPGVSSTALRMVPRRQRLEGARSEEWFFRGLRAAFGYRRKTLAQALATGLKGLNRETAAEILERAGIREGVRGEKLGLEEFVALGNALADWSGQK